MCFGFLKTFMSYYWLHQPGRPVQEETTALDFYGAGVLQAGCSSCRPTNSVKALKHSGDGS